MKKTGIIWSDKFTQYNLGEGHPMNARRLDIPYQLYKNLDILEDLKRGINRVAFAPETVEPSGSDKVVCHNCGCGC